MVSKVKGFIVTETPYGDNSKIINVLTEEYGLIGIMCSGVKSLKNPLRTKTLKFTYGYFYINYKEQKLSKLIDVDVINNFKNIRNNIVLISYLTYLTELTYQVYKQNNDNEIFNIFIKAVLKMEDGQSPSVLTNILEIKYLDFLGVGLNLEACIKCGNKTSIVTLDPDEGGFICSNCYQNEKIISSKSIKLLRMYYLIEIDSITKIDIKKEIEEEINYFLDKYYERYTGLYLKSKSFLKNLS